MYTSPHSPSSKVDSASSVLSGPELLSALPPHSQVMLLLWIQGLKPQALETYWLGLSPQTAFSKLLQCNSHSSLFCRSAIPAPLLESISSQMLIIWFKWALPGCYCPCPHAPIWLLLPQRWVKLVQWEPSRGGYTGDHEHRPVSVGSKALGGRGALLSEGTDI